MVFFLTTFLTLSSMGRVISGFVLLLFVAATLQVPFHTHYCGGEFQTWQLYTKVDNCCAHELHAEAYYSTPCCEDTILSKQFPPYQHTNTWTLPTCWYIAHPQVEDLLLLSQHTAQGEVFALPGPGPPTVSLFLLYATFRC